MVTFGERMDGGGGVGLWIRPASDRHLIGPLVCLWCAWGGVSYCTEQQAWGGGGSLVLTSRKEHHNNTFITHTHTHSEVPTAPHPLAWLPSARRVYANRRRTACSWKHAGYAPGSVWVTGMRIDTKRACEWPCLHEYPPHRCQQTPGQNQRVTALLIPSYTYILIYRSIAIDIY